MTYNFRLFWRMTYRSFVKTRGTHGRFNRRRLFFLFIFYTLWPAWSIITWFCLLLDDIFFPGHKTQPIEQPLFLLGNFRSGSSFLQRLLAQDKANFTTMRTWDIYLTPSITQRKLARLAARIDGVFGGHLLRAFIRFDNRSLGQVNIHPISFFSPEEDENILLFHFSTFFIGFLFPFLEELPPYAFFDDQISEKERNATMAFYRSCVQRHLYAHGGNIHFLSKNPSFSPKIATLKNFFPDARIIYLVRTPFEMLPSTVSWLSYVWHVFGEPLEEYPYKDHIFKFTQYWYRHALAYLDNHQSSNHLILKYEDLFHNTSQEIFNFYSRFGYQKSTQLETLVLDAIRENHRYQSEHEYSYLKMGFTKNQIQTGFADIIDRFGYGQITRSDTST